MCRLRVRRLPELDAIALRIGDPAELPVVALLELLVDVAAVLAQLAQHRVEIADAEVKVVLRRKAIVLVVTINQNLKEKAAEEIRVQIIVEQVVEGVEEDKMPSSLM